MNTLDNRTISILLHKSVGVLGWNALKARLDRLHIPYEEYNKAGRHLKVNKHFDIADAGYNNYVILEAKGDL